jgi:hypothetical protein
MILPDKLYQALKWAALIALPAVGTFYNMLAAIWALPFGEQVLATASALGLLIGALIGVSQYNLGKGAGPEGTD